MIHFTRFTAVILILAGLFLSACAPIPASAGSDPPVRIEQIEGTEFKRVILTEKAAQRLDIQTVAVRGPVVPYSAVIYDVHGNTWVYSNPEPLTFIRQAIVVERIDGDQAVLSMAMEPGSLIVTVGVAELYGAETGVSK